MQLAEKYQLIRKLARSFAETELTPEILDEVEDTGIFPAEIQKKMAETGFYGIKVLKSTAVRARIIWPTRSLSRSLPESAR